MDESQMHANETVQLTGKRTSIPIALNTSLATDLASLSREPRL